MITLAPIQVTQGETANLRMTYRENGIGKDWTDYDGAWVVVQKGTAIAAGVTTLETDGDMLTTISVTQLDTLSVPDQYRGRTLPETYFQITATGADVFHFRAAVTVLRGLNYGLTTVDTDSLLDDGGNTLLAE